VPDLPSGTVTFLFTDVESSTRLLKQLRARYGLALGDHQTILREAFALHGGREIDTQGDSFFVVFGTAKEGPARTSRDRTCGSAHGTVERDRSRLIR
jgi:class 3 adenylate cyclase